MLVVQVLGVATCGWKKGQSFFWRVMGPRHCNGLFVPMNLMWGCLYDPHFTEAETGAQGTHWRI